MENRRNYYRILHVQPDAPTEVIQASYRTLMQRLRMHPDLGGDHWNAAVINEAYHVLVDPGRRAAYDRTRPTEADGTLTRPLPACAFCGTAHGHVGKVPADALCSTCASPLRPASPLRLEVSDQRRVQRLDRRLPVTWYARWPATDPRHGETRDLSLSGCQFAADEAAREAQLLKLDCETLSAVVRVVSCASSAEATYPWLLRAEYVTLRFKRSRGSFLFARV
jgi:curved DNA-binding protein CbpA